MHRIAHVIILFAIVMAPLASGAHAQIPDEDCFEGTIEFTNTTGAEIDLNVAVYDSIFDTVESDSDSIETVAPGETVDVDFTITAPTDGDYDVVFGDGDLEADGVRISAVPIDPCIPFLDGRLNWTDAAAPATIYNLGNRESGVYDVYRVEANGEQGTRAFRVPATDVHTSLDTATSTGQNQLVQEGYMIALYALSSNECQVNAFYPDGSLYEFVFPCAPAF